MSALQSSARDLDLPDVDPERRAGVAQDAVVAQRQRWGRAHRRPAALSMREALTALRFEVLLVWTCAGNLRNGVELSDLDFGRLTLACNRIESILGEVLP